MDHDSEISFGTKTLDDVLLEHRIEVNPFTGAATATVSVPVTPGRSGFGPRLALNYSSSAGNSVYGVGWSLAGIAAVSIHTSKRLPTYDRQDTFAFNGTDELVQAMQEVGGAWAFRIYESNTHWIYYYRRRIETDYVRFEKWVDKNSGSVHWRARDHDNILSIFGLSPDGRTRIFDPDNPDHIYSWLLEVQYDQYGNAIFYEYDYDRRNDLDARPVYEHRRVLESSGFAQRYLKRIRYGNAIPLYADLQPPENNRWLFQIVFDFGDHGDHPLPAHGPDRAWPLRQDPFSTHRPGFEVRTYRLCRRVLMFHHFAELGEQPALVGMLGLGHAEDPTGSTLGRIQYEGFRKDDGSGVVIRKSLPPLKLEYSAPSVSQSFTPAPELTGENAPRGLDGLGYRWLDLYGEGLPGILSETNEAWYYKSSHGNGHFGTQQTVAQKPAQILGSYALSDFDGDGNPNIVVLQGRQAGFCEYDRDNDCWHGFKAFAASPVLDAADSPAWLDLNGDGQADLVLSKQDRFTWYPSKGKEGFGEAIELARPHTNGTSRLPQIAEELRLDLYFADMTGDGSLDQIHLENGSVEYWPQIGYGRFGDGVLMQDAPLFDFDGEFDPERVRLADIDGNGTADILYIGRGDIRYWINAGGNRFIEGGRLTGLPYIDNLSSVHILDFLGSGTPCLVWSSPNLDQSAHPIHYLELTVGIKPRLLIKADNSMGRVVQLTYASSSRHYLRDQNSGRGWATRLPSHTTVVDKIEVIDEIGNSRFVSIYEYHDGYFDSEEKEFRGFALVDQYDLEVYRGDPAMPGLSQTAPACRRVCFHTGAPPRPKRSLGQYYQGDGQHQYLPPPAFETLLDAGGPSFQYRFKALSGQIMRQEVYEVQGDGGLADHPYQVVQNSYRIRQLQPSGNAIKPCFAFYLSETLTHQYEQRADDPRMTHRFTLAVDAYGNITSGCDIAYPRRASMPSAASTQQRYYVQADSRTFLNIDMADRYQAGVALDHKQFEVEGLRPQANALFDFGTLRISLNTAMSAPLDFHEPFQPAAAYGQARLVQWQRSHYWNDDRSAAAPHGQAGRTILLHHQEDACFSEGLIGDVFGGLVVPSMLQNDGGYSLQNGYWWQKKINLHYLPAHAFHLLSVEERPNGNFTRYTYDMPYYLALTQVRDALGNSTRADIDYYTIAPFRITDPNENQSEVKYDPLGMIVISTVHGRILGPGGAPAPFGNDAIDTYVAQPDEGFAAIVAEPGRFVQNVGRFYWYELDTWATLGVPPRSIEVVREALVHDGRSSAMAESRVQILVTYHDGFGRPLQSKQKVEGGPAVRRDPTGAVMVDLEGRPQEAHSDERWLVSGHTVYNNKQLPVRQYEPFYSATSGFESDAQLQSFGVNTLTTYDAMGRERRIDLPNGTLSRVEILPWEVRNHDANDTINESLYKALREWLPNSDPQKLALLKAQAHAGTPVVDHLDPLGRAIMRVESDGSGHDRVTTYNLDSQGGTTTIIDPRGLTAFSYRRDMLGRVLYQQSVDAGELWRLPNFLDRSLYQWDGRGVHTMMRYDALDRPTSVYAGGVPGLDQIVERMVYGEDAQVADAVLRNARGRLVVHFDQAGRLTVGQFDFAGNPMHTERRLLTDYKNEPDWTPAAGAPLEATSYGTLMAYDALGRVTYQAPADGTFRFMEYLPGGGLARLAVTTSDGVLNDAAFMRAAEYNARGQRTRVVLGNGVELTYRYDPETFRLQRVTAIRPPPSLTGNTQTLLDIEYTYDAVGNLVHSVDHAQQPSTPFNLLQGLTVSAHNEFTYDALYQLKAATGRVHQALLPHDYLPERPGTLKGTRHLHLNNGQAVERYQHTYDYDLSGNIQRMRHQGQSRSWTMDIWTSTASNRSLPQRDPAGNPVTNREARFDANGNTVYLPHLAAIHWNHRNNIARAVVIDRSAAGQVDDAEYYVYGGTGRRVRKVTETLVNGAVMSIEKIYAEGCEIKRIRFNGQLRLERRTAHIVEGENRIALLHQWTLDRSAAETDNVQHKGMHYQIVDQRGSALMEVDENAALISYEEYFPYGGSAFIAGDQVRQINLKDYRYAGKERDEATGLYNYEYRYYAPWIGNWLSPDPVGPEDSLNLYQFVHNNPVNLRDERGLKSKKAEEQRNPFPYLSLFSERLTLNWKNILSGSETGEGEPEAETESPDAGVRSPDAGVRSSGGEGGLIPPGGVSEPVWAESLPSYEEQALDAGVPLNPYGEFIFTGGAYGSEVDPFTPGALLGQLHSLLPDAPYLLFGSGVLAIAVGVVIISTEGAGPLLLLSGALALSSGIATVAVTPIVATLGDEQDIEILSTVLAFSSGLGPLAGGLGGLLYYGDEEGFAKGVLVGALTEAVLTLGYTGGKALYSRSSYGRAERALNLLEGEYELAVRANFTPAYQNLPQNFVVIDITTPNRHRQAIEDALATAIPPSGPGFDLPQARDVLYGLQSGRLQLRLVHWDEWRRWQERFGGIDPHDVLGTYEERTLLLRILREPGSPSGYVVGLDTVIHEGWHILDPIPRHSIAELLARERNAWQAQSDFIQAIGGRALFENPLDLELFIQRRYGRFFQQQLNQPGALTP
jgi:RHS repeat-associated protein